MAEEATNEVIQLGDNIPPEQRKRMEEIIAHAEANAPLPKPEQPQEQEEPEQPQEQEEPKACARCGHTPDTSKPNEDDVREYTRAILGGRAFSKAYEIMGGQIILKMTALTSDEGDKLNTHILGLRDVTDPVEFSQVLSKYRALFYLRTLQLGDGEAKNFDVPMQPSNRKELEAAFAKRFTGLPEAVVGMVARCVGLFRTLEQSLLAQSFDENFWTGAGPF